MNWNETMNIFHKNVSWFYDFINYHINEDYCYFNIYFYHDKIKYIISIRKNIRSKKLSQFTSFAWTNLRL